MAGIDSLPDHQYIRSDSWQRNGWGDGRVVPSGYEGLGANEAVHPALPGQQAKDYHSFESGNYSNLPKDSPAGITVTVHSIGNYGALLHHNRNLRHPNRLTQSRRWRVGTGAVWHSCRHSHNAAAQLRWPAASCRADW